MEIVTKLEFNFFINKSIFEIMFEYQSRRY